MRTLRSIPPKIPHRGSRALRRGRLSLAGHAYSITIVTRGRKPVFTQRKAAQIACEGFCNPAFLAANRLLAWVLMPDHAHWLLQLGEGEDLSASVRRLKSATARLVNREIGTPGALWQAGFHDHVIRCDEDLHAVAEYLCANPLRAGLVERVEDYPYWGSIWGRAYLAR